MIDIPKGDRSQKAWEISKRLCLTLDEFQKICEILLWINSEHFSFIYQKILYFLYCHSEWSQKEHFLMLTRSNQVC